MEIRNKARTPKQSPMVDPTYAFPGHVLGLVGRTREPALADRDFLHTPMLDSERSAAPKQSIENTGRLAYPAQRTIKCRPKEKRP